MERTISLEEFKSIDAEETVILDVRRDNDYESAGEIIPGSTWKNPANIDEWVSSVPKDGQVIIYCARGGGVSNSIVDRLHEEGVNAQFIEGGIEGLKESGGTTVPK